jgi:hypothetical protein
MTRSLEMKVTDDQFFTRSKSGAIWGRVYFEIGDSFFPDNGWTDLIAAFTTAWLEALTRIATGSVASNRIWFMDGPFAVDVSASGHGVLKVTFLHKEAVKHSAEAILRDLLENATTVSKQVLASSELRGWSGKDVGDLAAATQRGVEALRSLKGLP